MRVRRVRVAALQAGTVRLVGKEAHHLARVLRLASGDPVQAFDGSGLVADGVVAGVEEGAVNLTLEAPREGEREAPIRVTLAVSLLKGDKLAGVVRQATELGVHAVQLVHARRADVPTLGAAKAKRLVRIAEEAAKQSGRSSVPEVRDPIALRDVVGSEPTWIADPRGDRFYGDVVDAWLEEGQEAVTIVTGPEGGFEPGEVTELVAQGAVAVRFGARILRAETAPIALAAALLGRVDG